MVDRLSPEYREMLDLIPDGLLDLSDIPRTREQAHVRVAAAAARTKPLAGVAVRDEVVPGSDGRPDLVIRLYLPDCRSAPSGALYFIHGGGYVLGELAQFDVHCTEVAAGTGCVVASIDYRLAPEHPYPAPLEDCYAGLEFLVSHASRLGLDRSRVAVGGNSAGGALAAAVALLARDRVGPQVAFQLLEAPMLDHRDRPSSGQDDAHPKVWNRQANQLAWQAYLGAVTDGPIPPYASPSLSADLAGLPPAYLAVSALELFLDETVTYARRLTDAGVGVELHVYPDGFHGSAWALPDAEQSRRWRADSISALRAAVGEAR